MPFLLSDGVGTVLFQPLLGFLLRKPSYRATVLRVEGFAVGSGGFQEARRDVGRDGSPARLYQALGENGW